MGSTEPKDDAASVRIVCIADTHAGHRRARVPEGDLLVVAGDLTRQGSLESLADFDAFLADLPHPHKVVVAGNHDFCFEDDPDAARETLSSATYLQDESITIAGLRIYGSPWQPRLVETDRSIFAFDLPRGEALAEKWRAIPGETDLLITHSPPYGIRDEIYTGDRIGCRALRERIDEVDPLLHVFGHVHENPGVERTDSTVFVNAATPGGYGSVAVVDVAPDGRVEVVDPGDWLPDWIRERMDRKAARHRS